MDRKILYLKNSVGDWPAFLPALKGCGLHVVQQYEAERLDWHSYQIVIISMFADQIHLDEIRGKISAYLDAGGTLIINGHIARPFLPELSRYEPMPKRGLAELVIHREAEHPAFAGIEVSRLGFRKGVAGFYGRGSNPPPKGAQVIYSVGPDHVAVDWIYERPEGGRIFVHSGIELWMFLASGSDILDTNTGDEPNYLQQFFDWFFSTSPLKLEDAA